MQTAETCIRLWLKTVTFFNEAAARRPRNRTRRLSLGRPTPHFNEAAAPRPRKHGIRSKRYARRSCFNEAAARSVCW